MTDENVNSKFESIPRFLRNHFVVTFSISNYIYPFMFNVCPARVRVNACNATILVVLLSCKYNICLLLILCSWFVFSGNMKDEISIISRLMFNCQQSSEDDRQFYVFPCEMDILTTRRRIPPQPLVTRVGFRDQWWEMEMENHTQYILNTPKHVNHTKYTTQKKFGNLRCLNPYFILF